VGQRGNKILKRIDRWVGIALITFLRLLKWRRPIPLAPQHIGLMVTAAIGDTILVSALARALKHKFPAAKIVLIHGATNSLIVPYIAGVDETLLIPVTKPWVAVRKLRNMQLDVLIDTGQWARLNALLSFFSGANYTVGFKTEQQHRHYLFDAAIPHSEQVHEVENYLSLGGPWGVLRKTAQLQGLPPVEAQNQKVLFHVKPSGEKSWLKEWPSENWVLLINHFTAQGMGVQLTGSPDDRGALMPLLAQVANPEKVEMLAGGSFADTLRALQAARLVVSVNTGIMHIAAVLGKNLVALHGPTNPRRWGPVNSNAISLESNLTCAPCLNLGFEYGCEENRCMQSLSIRMVVSACEKMLR